ncbi:MAG: rod shape-determining protein MreD [Lachnospiraceae bacterium]|nr:rod shape-determining protein MreD [Lachnospiraceae bacterium]MEE1014470.1 rod shape-determining protein MreD [Lachnospiraceae bacterium]
MKKRICMFFLVVFCFILQNTVLKALELGAVSPNLLLVITAAIGFIGGRKEGMYMGVLCGMFTDIFYGQLFGYYTLLYTLIGYANGFFHAVFYDLDIKQPMLLIAMSDLAYGLIQYFFQFLLRGKFDFGFYFTSVILPEFLYTVVLILLFYRGILVLYEKLDKLDNTGSVDEFV